MIRQINDSDFKKISNFAFIFRTIINNQYKMIKGKKDLQNESSKRLTPKLINIILIIINN